MGYAPDDRDCTLSNKVDLFICEFINPAMIIHEQKKYEK